MRDSFGAAFRYGRANVENINEAKPMPLGGQYVPAPGQSDMTIEQLKHKLQQQREKAEADRIFFAPAPVLPPPGKVPAPYAASETPFFTIWREYGASPTVKHFTIQSVEDEAERLSKANPGAKFYVMSSLASVVTGKAIAPPTVFTRAYGIAAKQ